jgi:hypothetical protein
MVPDIRKRQERLGPPQCLSCLRPSKVFLDQLAARVEHKHRLLGSHDDDLTHAMALSLGANMGTLFEEGVSFNGFGVLSDTGEMFRQVATERNFVPQVVQLALRQRHVLARFRKPEHIVIEYIEASGWLFTETQYPECGEPRTYRSVLTPSGWINEYLVNERSSLDFWTMAQHALAVAPRPTIPLLDCGPSRLPIKLLRVEK